MFMSRCIDHQAFKLAMDNYAIVFISLNLKHIFKKHKFQGPKQLKVRYLPGTWLAQDPSPVSHMAL